VAPAYPDDSSETPIYFTIINDKCICDQCQQYGHVSSDCTQIPTYYQSGWYANSYDNYGYSAGYGDNGYEQGYNASDYHSADYTHGGYY
jgi:hypothetical protein